MALHVVNSGPPTVTAALFPPYLRFKVHPALWTIGQTSFRGEHVTNFIFKHRTAEILLVRRYESLGWGHVLTSLPERISAQQSFKNL